MEENGMDKYVLLNQIDLCKAEEPPLYSIVITVPMCLIVTLVVTVVSGVHLLPFLLIFLGAIIYKTADDYYFSKRINDTINILYDKVKKDPEKTTYYINVFLREFDQRFRFETRGASAIKRYIKQVKRKEEILEEVKESFEILLEKI